MDCLLHSFSAKGYVITLEHVNGKYRCVTLDTTTWTTVSTYEFYSREIAEANYADMCAPCNLPKAVVSTTTRKIEEESEMEMEITREFLTNVNPMLMEDETVSDEIFHVALAHPKYNVELFFLFEDENYRTAICLMNKNYEVMYDYVYAESMSDENVIATALGKLLEKWGIISNS